MRTFVKTDRSDGSIENQHFLIQLLAEDILAGVLKAERT